MRLYEDEAKRVFELEGIKIPDRYGIIKNRDDVEECIRDSKFPIIMKSLVLVGGRGKAGGVKIARDRDEAVRILDDMLGMNIKGYIVERILVEEVVEEIASCYIGVTMNPSTFNNIIMVSAAGGVEIERIAEESPESIFKIELKENEKFLPEELADSLVNFLIKSKGLLREYFKEIRFVISKIYEIYQKYDCKVTEINPLMISNKGPIAADAKIVLDDNGLFRQGDLLGSLEIKEIRHDVSEPTRNEIRARSAGFPYVDLLPEDHKKDSDKLYVGLVPGGAGYGIFSIDETVNVGNRFFEGRVIPVNFMDSGGGPSQKRVEEMFHLLMDYEIVDIIITSRFGGISSCDTFIRGLVSCFRNRYKNGKRIVPVYGRMVGTDLPSARDYLERSKRETPEELKDMEITVGNRKIMAEIIREGVEKAFKMRGWNR